VARLPEETQTFPVSERLIWHRALAAVIVLLYKGLSDFAAMDSGHRGAATGRDAALSRIRAIDNLVLTTDSMSSAA
jgi:hypothetical protein